ncbi:MAG: exonuclease SbcCD subunit D [Actinoallomurus sp.]
MLHTSDWHIGKPVTGGHSRHADYQAVVAEITEIAQANEPDLIVHTGDLFDRAQPASADLALGVKALVELAGVAPTVMVGGNHDSPAMLRSFDLLVNALTAADGPSSRLRFIPVARLAAQGGILDFATTGGQRIRLAALPFVHRNRAVEGFERPEAASVIYADYLRGIQAELGRGLRDGYVPERDVLVFAAHLYVESALLSWTERELDVTQDYACHVDALPDVAYCALGHIHKPQAIRRPGVTARYAGSPLQLDFGEENETKSVVLVDANPGRPTRTQIIPLRSGRRLMTFTGDLEHLATQADQIGNAFVKAIIDVEGPSPGLATAVQAIIPHATLVDLQERHPGWEEVPVLGAHSEIEPEPELTDVFREYLTSEGGIAPQRLDHVQQAFTDLLSAAEYDELATDPVAQLLQAALQPQQH